MSVPPAYVHFTDPIKKAHAPMSIFRAVPLTAALTLSLSLQFPNRSSRSFLIALIVVSVRVSPGDAVCRVVGMVVSKSKLRDGDRTVEAERLVCCQRFVYEYPAQKVSAVCGSCSVYEYSRLQVAVSSYLTTAEEFIKVGYVVHGVLV